MYRYVKYVYIHKCTIDITEYIPIGLPTMESIASTSKLDGCRSIGPDDDDDVYLNLSSHH
jgi:hypothetical protein